MTYAYQVTQFNGIDYSTKSPKWNLVAERRTQQQALAVCQTLNQRQPYFHRVEVVKAVELPKFSILKPAKNEQQTLVIPASFKVIKNLLQEGKISEYFEEICPGSSEMMERYYPMWNMDRLSEYLPRWATSILGCKNDEERGSVRRKIQEEINENF